jgi:hypothetical protein
MINDRRNILFSPDILINLLNPFPSGCSRWNNPATLENHSRGGPRLFTIVVNQLRTEMLESPLAKVLGLHGVYSSLFKDE